VKISLTPICQATFVVMKKKLVETPIFVRPNFNKTFILDVEWSIKSVGIIMSQKSKRQAEVAYANKRISPIQKIFHPMEGKCYALI
jgi:hypothetical protein